MADAITGSTWGKMLGQYYDKVLLERAVPNLVFYKLADKKPLPKGEGKTVVWHRLNVRAAGSALTEGTKPDATTLSAQSVSATIRQLGDLVAISDILDLTGICDLVKETVSVLGEGAALTVDQVIEQRMGISVRGSSVCTRQAHPVFDMFIRYAAGTFGLRQGGSNLGMNGSMISSQALAVSCIRKMVSRLRMWNAPTFSDGYYRLVVHPNVSQQIRTDKEFQNWTQYTQPEKMEKGECGRVEGAVVLETTNVTSYAGATVGSGSSLGTIYPSYLLANHAIGVTEINGKAIETAVITKPDFANPFGQWKYVGYKVTMAAKILNDSCGLVAVTNVS